MDIQELTQALPGIVSDLTRMMVDDALPALESMGGIETATPAVSISFVPKDGSAPFKVTLEVSTDDTSDEDEELVEF